MPENPVRFAPLPELATISVTGSDAASFLGAQLSQTPPKPGTARAPLAAWADAKGRVQALFRVVHRDDGYLLITHGSVVDEVSASLRRYVLRADVAIDVATEVTCAALLGESTPWFAEQGIELGLEAGDIAGAREAIWLRLGPALVHVVAARDKIEQLAAMLTSGSEDEAELAEIRLGLPAVSAPLRGEFLPQMLNLEVLGGVAFDKGCYPGQEIIARTQNLGTVKRRLLRFSMAANAEPPPAGTALIDESGQTAGVVVRSARSEHGVELLAVVTLDLAAGPLRCSGTVDLELEHGTLPYAVPGAD